MAAVDALGSPGCSMGLWGWAGKGKPYTVLPCAQPAAAPCLSWPQHPGAGRWGDVALAALRTQAHFGGPGAAQSALLAMSPQPSVLPAPGELDTGGRGSGAGCK